jgi:hypothetical protein
MPEKDEKVEASTSRLLTDEETQDVSAGLSDDPPNPSTDPADPVPPPPTLPGG